MPAYNNFSQGTPFWVTLSSPNIAEAMAFYAHLLGWEYEEAPPDESGQSRMAWAQISSGYVAEISSPPGADDGRSSSTQWNVILIVEDMAEVLRRVPDFGGAVVSPVQDVGDVGRSAVVTDPIGCVLNLFEAHHSGSVIMHEHGAMQWFELMTPDTDVTGAFIRGVFGVKTEPSEMPDGSTNWIIWTGDGPVASIAPLSGLSEASARGETGPMWVTYFNVDDVDAAVARAVKPGAYLPDPPWDVPGIGRIAWIYDPQGARLGLIRLATDQS